MISGSEAAWSMIPGFWSTIGDKTLRYRAWGDGWDEQRFEDDGEAFTVWYGKATAKAEAAPPRTIPKRSLGGYYREHCDYPD